MSIHEYKKNNKTFYYVKYQNKTARGFKDKKSAKIQEAIMILESLDADDRPLFFSELVDDFLNECSSNVSVGTYKTYQRLINNFILPNMKDKLITSITQNDCRAFRNALQKMKYSTKYKNTILTLYKGIFKHATIYFDLPKNPSICLKSFKPTFEERQKKKVNEKNIWNIDTFNSFIKCVDEPLYKVFFTVLYHSGLRLGEILALTWEDYFDGSLEISKNLTRKTDKGFYEIKSTKNVFSERTVTLSCNVNAMLLEYRENEEKKNGFNSSWFIFGGIKPLAENTIRRRKNDAVNKANIRNIRIHDFRHSHVSNLIANDVNIVSVSKRIGHCDVQMTLSVYTHLMNEHDEKMLEYLDKSSQKVL